MFYTVNDNRERAAEDARERRARLIFWAYELVGAVLIIPQVRFVVREEQLYFFYSNPFFYILLVANVAVFLIYLPFAAYFSARILPWEKRRRKERLGLLKWKEGKCTRLLHNIIISIFFLLYFAASIALAPFFHYLERFCSSVSDAIYCAYSITLVYILLASVVLAFLPAALVINSLCREFTSTTIESLLLGGFEMREIAASKLPRMTKIFAIASFFLLPWLWVLSIVLGRFAGDVDAPWEAIPFFVLLSLVFSSAIFLSSKLAAAFSVITRRPLAAFVLTYFLLIIVIGLEAFPLLVSFYWGSIYLLPPTSNVIIQLLWSYNLLVVTFAALLNYIIPSLILKYALWRFDRKYFE